MLSTKSLHSRKYSCKTKKQVIFNLIVFEMSYNPPGSPYRGGATNNWNPQPGPSNQAGDQRTRLGEIQNYQMPPSGSGLSGARPKQRKNADSFLTQCLVKKFNAQTVDKVTNSNFTAFPILSPFLQSAK